MTKLIVAFRNFVNVPKKGKHDRINIVEGSCNSPFPSVILYWRLISLLMPLLSLIYSFVVVCMFCAVRISLLFASLFFSNFSSDVPFSIHFMFVFCFLFCVFCGFVFLLYCFVYCLSIFQCVITVVFYELILCIMYN